MATSRANQPVQPPDRTPRAATHAELADTIPPWATQGELVDATARYAHAPQGTMSPSIRHDARRPGVSGRPSLFHEGSMNDRVSDRPPASFTGDDVEVVMERYAQEASEDVRTARGGPSWLKKPLPDLPGNDLAASTRTTTTTTVTNQSTRSSVDMSASEQDPESVKRPGIVRIGKSLAAAFANPAGMWDDLTQRRRHGREEPPRMDLQLWEDRRKRAEQAYAAMKRDERFPAPKPTTTPAIKARRGGGRQQASREAQSQDWTQLEGKGSEKAKMNPLQAVDGNRLQVPSPTKEGIAMSSPERDPRTAHWSSSTFKKRSVPNFKKVKSDIHRLTSESLTALLPVPSAPPVSADEDLSESTRVVRPQASRKDLNRQHKLSKRVSDLESKLESARRELDEVMGKSTPVTSPTTTSTASVYHASTRRPFVPGLSSLPSERILLREREAEGPVEIEKHNRAVHEMDVDAVRGACDLKKDTRRTQRNKVADVTGEPSKRASGKRKSMGPDADATVADDDEKDSSVHQSGSKRRRSNKGQSQLLPSPKFPKDGIYELDGSSVGSTMLRRPSEKVLEPRPRMVGSIAENSLSTSVMTGGSSSSSVDQVQRQEQPGRNLRPRRSSLAAFRGQTYQAGSIVTAALEQNMTRTKEGAGEIKSKPEPVTLRPPASTAPGESPTTTTAFKDDHHPIKTSSTTTTTSPPILQETKNLSTTHGITEASEIDATEPHHHHHPPPLDAVEEVEEEEEMAERRKKGSTQRRMDQGRDTQEFEWPDDVF